MDVYEVFRVGFAALLFLVVATGIGLLFYRKLRNFGRPKMAKVFFIAYGLILIISVLRLLCGEQIIDRKHENAILLADREAPLGWVYLSVFSDSSFEFESRGLERHGDIYAGKAKITADSIFFYYKDSIPHAGSIAVYSDKYIAYVNGSYPEKVEIRLSKLSAKKGN